MNISTPYCGETITISDKYLFLGPVFNDISTVGFTHPVLKHKLVDAQLRHVSVGTEVGQAGEQAAHVPYTLNTLQQLTHSAGRCCLCLSYNLCVCLCVCVCVCVCALKP